ncbi:MAG: precorrin-8X methylmutase [Bacillota bacterium]|nr:precorrin-8X methylmutase [Bacillota bacterium]
MEYIIDPKEIEKRSMEIISDLIGPLDNTVEEQAIIKRIIHTTGDPEYRHVIKIHPEAVANGLEALRQGSKIYTDVRMVLTGINKKKLAQLNSSVECGIDREDVIATALKTGETRAITAMKLFGEQLHDSVVAIGNAPTALFQLLKLVDEGIRPKLIVGTPVGFVGAKESKELLETYDIPYITVAGFKGGSAVAAAAVNALLLQL